MTSREPSHFVLGVCVAAAMLAGCGGSQPPIGVPGAMPQTSATTHADRGKSWMLPEARNEELLYIAVSYSGVSVLSYPFGKLVGQLEGFMSPTGLCADKQGNVFVVDAQTDVISEYAHGSTSPIRKLAGAASWGCYVDPTTGNLAAVGGAFRGEGVVAIYRHARGGATVYSDTNMGPLSYCTYDDQGNVFAEGYVAGEPGRGWLVELPRAASKLTTLQQNFSFTSGGGIQWDGKHLAMQDPTVSKRDGPIIILQVAVAGSSATVAGTRDFYTSKHDPRNPGPGTESWIHDSSFIDAANHAHGIGVWTYPKAGELIKRFGLKGRAQAVTISVAGSPNHRSRWPAQSSGGTR